MSNTMENAIRDLISAQYKQREAMDRAGRTSKELRRAREFFARVLADQISPHLSFKDRTVRLAFDEAMKRFLMPLVSNVPGGEERKIMASDIGVAVDSLSSYTSYRMNKDMKEWRLEEVVDANEANADADA